MTDRFPTTFLRVRNYLRRKFHRLEMSITDECVFKQSQLAICVLIRLNSLRIAFSFKLIFYKIDKKILI